MMADRRLAVISDAAGYVGPSLAQLLAPTHDLVLGDPQEGLIEEVRAAGAAVEAVNRVRDLSDPAAADRLVGGALARFGRLDAAVAFPAGSLSVGSCARRWRTCAP